jgi:hypothetical protein
MKLSNTSVVIEDVKLDIQFYYYSGRPAKLSGPWEDSYPEEYPEVDIDIVTVSGTDIEIGCLLSDDTFRKIETYILENHENDSYHRERF